MMSDRIRSQQAGGTLTVILLALVLAYAVYYSMASRMRKPPTPPAPEGFYAMGEQPPVEPEPPPVFAPEDILMAAETFKEEEGTLFDQRMPPVTVGQTVDLRLINGQVARGEVTEISSNQLAVFQNSTTNRILFSQLDTWERLRVDPSLRTAAIHFRSVTLARAELLTLGTLAEITFTNLESMTLAAEAGDAKAMDELGMRLLAGRGLPADPGRGFSMVYLAAQTEYAPAQHHVGVLTYQGTAVAPNPTTGLRWISLAARADYKPAQEFLTQQRIEQTRLNGLAMEQQRSVDQDRAAYAERLETIRAKDSERSILKMIDFKRKLVSPENDSNLTSWYDSQGRRHVRTGHK
jgi:hypothetical protein